jgi:hypothetical protein
MAQIDTVADGLRLSDMKGTIEWVDLEIEAGRSCSVVNDIVNISYGRVIVYDVLQRKVVYYKEVHEHFGDIKHYVENGAVVSDDRAVWYLYIEGGEMRVKVASTAGDKICVCSYEPSRRGLVLRNWKMDVIDTLDIDRDYEVISKMPQ